MSEETIRRCVWTAVRRNPWLRACADDLAQEARLALWINNAKLLDERYVTMEVWRTVQNETAKERSHHGSRGEMPLAGVAVLNAVEAPETMEQEMLRMRGEGFSTSDIGDVVGMRRTEVMTALRLARKAA